MNQKDILVVDDNEKTRNLFEEVFTQAGYLIHLAEDAEKALEILKAHKIQVMFLDLNLPGMNGVDLCRQIRKDSPIALIHAVTGYSSIFEFDTCRDAGFDGYFHKPVNMQMLLELAKTAFDKLDKRKKK